MASQEGVCHSLDDELDEVLEPPLDEFDMWDHQQALNTMQQSPEKRAMISHLQKSFLDQLNSECDLNAAAAKAILSLKGTSPSSASTELPEMPGATEREFVIFDEDERFLLESVSFAARSQGEALDAFDLLAARSEAVNQMDEERQRLVTKMQAKFLDALDNEDVNGAAAVALKQLLTSKPSKDARSQKAQERFQVLFQENLVKLQDPNAAAALALRTLAGRH